MSLKKEKYVTAQEIDGMTAIKSPHAQELEELGKRKINLFLKNKKRRIKIVVEDQLKGELENIGFDEEYTVTFEYFPEVKVHILFSDYEDEEFGGAEVKFLFSGVRVMWVPTEDSIGLIETTLDYLENLLADSEEIHRLTGKASDLLNMSIEQRKAPFVFLKSEHLGNLVTFVGGELKQIGKGWTLAKTYFEGITVLLIYDQEKERLGVGYEGENLIKINNYARDQLGIFLINHCLRFIRVTYPEIKMPKIVQQMFSYSYIKSHF